MATVLRASTDWMPAEIWMLIGEILPLSDLLAIGATGKHLRNILMPLLRGCKLLQVAARRDENTSVDLLLNCQPINIRVSDANNMTILHYAVLKGFKEMTRLLTRTPQYKAILNWPDSLDGDAPIITAARHRRKEILQLLLEGGAKVNACNVHGESALFWAIKNNREDFIQILLTRGANPDQSVRHGLTPLILAIMDHRRHLVALLAEGGCDVQQPDARGYRPLSWAVITDDLPIAQLLLTDDTISPSTPNGADRSPLVWAVMKGNPEMVRLLLPHCTDITQKQSNRRSPLIWAVIHRDISMAELLLDSGAPLEEADETGQTALIWATLNDDEAMVNLLSKYGACLVDIEVDKWSVFLLHPRERLFLTADRIEGIGTWEEGIHLVYKAVLEIKSSHQSLIQIR